MIASIPLNPAIILLPLFCYSAFAAFICLYSLLSCTLFVNDITYIISSMWIRAQTKSEMENRVYLHAYHLLWLRGSFCVCVQPVRDHVIHCNVFSHWLGAYAWWQTRLGARALKMYCCLPQRRDPMILSRCVLNASLCRHKTMVVIWLSERRMSREPGWNNGVRFRNCLGALCGCNDW